MNKKYKSHKETVIGNAIKLLIDGGMKANDIESKLLVGFEERKLKTAKCRMRKIIKTQIHENGGYDCCGEEDIIIDDSLRDFLYGTLIGDGYLRKNKGGKSNYGYSDVSKNVILYVANELTRNKFECNIYYHAGVWVVETKRYKKLSDFRNLFYPNEKLITPDICLTPNILKWWYIDDGTYIKNKGGAAKIYCKKDQRYNKHVHDQLKQILNWDIKWQKDGIYIPSIKMNEFFNYIGGCPIKEYLYKWGVNE